MAHSKGHTGGEAHGAGAANDDDAPRIVSGEELQRRYHAKLEKRLPGGKRTKRLPVLKLEVGTGDIIEQIGIVSKRIFGLDRAHSMDDKPMATVPSRNYQHWRVTDDVLFGESKTAYDGIVTPFTKQPRVYKLASIKEKVWEMSRDKSAEEDAARDAEYERKQKLLDDRRKKMDAKMKAKPPPALGAKGAEIMAAREAETEQVEYVPPAPFANKDEELETFLDPYEPPKPWLKEIWNNKLSYINDETKERIYTRPPGGIFGQKLELLSKLTPRDDLMGYEYRENEQERRKRMRLMAEFDRLMKEEIDRRENEPNDIEIIEDCLYDMVESVHLREERRSELLRRKEKRAVKATWHVMCKGFRMKPLVPIENEQGELETAVTDEDFTDMIVSHTGHMVALQTPPGFYEKHEAERAVQRAIEDEKRAMEEFERNRPFKDKARIVLALARNDPKAAVKRVASGIKERALAIPRSLRSIDRRVVLRATQRIAINGFLSLVQAGKNPRATMQYIQERFKKVYAEMFPREEADEQMEELLKALSGEKEEEVKDEGPVETEAQRTRRLWLAAQPKPVVHPDTVMVRMTFLVDPPPIFVMRPPPTWKDHLVEAEAVLRHQQKLNQEAAKQSYSKYYPQMIDSVNECLALLGRDNIEIDETYHEEQLRLIDKERRRRKPLKPWEQRRFVSPPPRKPRKQKQQEEEDPSSTAVASLEADGVNAHEAPVVTGVADVDALLATPSTIPEAAAGPVPVPVPVPVVTDSTVAGETALVSNTVATPAVADPATTASTDDASAAQPPSPERRGRSVTIPKMGPLPPMTLYVPHQDEIKDRLRAIPADMERLKERLRERMRTLPGEVKENVKRIVEEIRNPPPPRDVFDTREREIFEKMLIQEVSQAVLIPACNIKLEEVRRMDKNHPKILALLQRKKEREQAYEQKQREKHEAHMVERQRRKALMKDPLADNEDYYKKLAAEFIENEAERWGADVEKLTGGRILKTVYRGPGWHSNNDVSAITDYKGRHVPLTHPQHPLHDPAVHGKEALEGQAQLAIEAGKGPGGATPRPGESGETLYNALIEDQPMLALGNGTHDGGEDRGEGEGTMALGSSLEAAAGGEGNSLAAGESALLGSSLAGSTTLDGGASLSLSAGASTKGSASAGAGAPPAVSALSAPGAASVLSKDDQDDEDSQNSRSYDESSSSSRWGLQPEVISQEEIARIHALRELRLSSYDEELVNLVEELSAEVVARDFEERRAAEAANFEVPDSKVDVLEAGSIQYFRLGLRNPEVLKHDANYWLAKSIRPATKVELRERRLARLRMSHQKEGLELRLQQLRELKELLLYDVHEYYDENIEPVVEGVIKPLARKARALVRAKMHEYRQTLERFASGAKSQLLAALQEGLLQLQPRPRILHDAAQLLIEPEYVMSRAEIEAAYRRWWREVALPRRVLTAAAAASKDSTPPPPTSKTDSAPSGASVSSELSTSDATAVAAATTAPAPAPVPAPAPEGASASSLEPEVVDCVEDLVLQVLGRLEREDEQRAQRQRERAARVYESEFLDWARGRVAPLLESRVEEEEEKSESVAGSVAGTATTSGSVKAVDSSEPSEPLGASTEVGVMGGTSTEIKLSGPDLVAPVSVPAPLEESSSTAPEMTQGIQPDTGVGVGAGAGADAVPVPVSPRSSGRSPVPAPRPSRASLQEQSAQADSSDQSPETSVPIPEQALEQQQADSPVLVPAPTPAEQIAHCANDLCAAVAQRCLFGLSSSGTSSDNTAVLSAEDLAVLDQSVQSGYPASLQAALVLQQTVTAAVERSENQLLAAVTPQWMELQRERERLRAQRLELEAIEREKEERRQALMSSDNLRSLGRLSKEDEQALAEAEEANISDEIKKIRAAQEAERAETEMRARFRRLRRQRRRVYESDVVDLLNKMCIAVELSAEFGENPLDLLPEIEDDYDIEQGKAETDSNPPTPREKKKKNKRKDGEQGENDDEGLDDENILATSDKAELEGEDAPKAKVEEEEEEEPVLGCEVTFMLYVTDKERALPGLDELQAEDIAVMLLQQFENPKSQLRSGYLGKTLLDVEYKSPFKKQLFHTWESFWVHVISPVFFYRTAAKSSTKREKVSDGRLESGLMMVNPTWEFTERSKETFLMYQQKYARKPKAPKAGQPVDAEAAALAAQIKAKADAKKAKNASVVDLNVDEFAKDVKALQIVRPNMSTITKKDVERLRRIAGAFDENYKKEMLKGLVDGERLHLAQFEALKNRDIAHRIYMNAKSKLNSDMRNAGLLKNPLDVPVNITHISEEQFSEWIEELRREQSKDLRELGLKKAAEKDLRDQESKLRRKYGKQRYWVINYKLNQMPNPAEIGPSFHREVTEFAAEKQKFLLKELNDVEAAKHLAKVNKLAGFTIHDEKLTRALFETITQWVHRKNRRLAASKLKSMQIVRKRRDSAMMTALLLGVGDIQASEMDKLKAGVKALGNIVEDDEEEESEPSESEKSGGEGSDSESSKGSDGDGGENGKAQTQSETAGSKSQGGAEKPAPKRRRKKTHKEKSIQIPFIYKEELLSFLEVYFMQLAHEQAQAKEFQEEYDAVKIEVAKLRQSMAFMGKVAASSEKEDVMAEIARRKEEKKAALALAPGTSVGRRGSFLQGLQEATQAPAARRMSVVAADAGLAGASQAGGPSGTKANSAGSAASLVNATKSAMQKIREAGLELMPREMEVCKEVHWIGVIKDDTHFYDALKNLPLDEAPKVARDELIQFSTMLCEIVPLFGKVTRLVSKEKEEALIAAGFRAKNKEEDAARAAQGLTKKQQKELEREAARKEREKNLPLTAEQRAKREADQEAKALQKGMGEEGIRRLRKAQEAERRKAARETAWLKAHPHRFIKYPGQMAFCIVCKVRTHEAWLDEFNAAEKHHLTEFEEDLQDNMEDYVPRAEAVYDGEMKERLERVEEDLKEQYKYEEKVKEGEKYYKKQMKEYDKAKRKAKETGAKEPPRPQKPYFKPFDFENTEMKRWRKKRIYEPCYTDDGQLIPEGIVLSELPLIDADGKSILPPPPDEEGEIAESSDDEEAGQGAHEHETRGIKVRVWQRDGPGERGAFLGCVHLKEEVVMDPPKGQRTYPLKGDGFVTRKMEKAGKAMVTISGSLTLQLKIEKFDKVKSTGEKVPRRWRLQVARGNKLATADRLRGTTAFCEIFWMGLAIKEEQLLDYGGRWLCVGETKEKPKTVEPVWDREDNSVYELPPVWTDMDIPKRGPAGGDLKGGGWVAQNNVPTPIDVNAVAAVKGRLSRRRLRAAMMMAIAAVRILRARKAVREEEVRRLVATARELWIAEERERKCMAREERTMRNFLMHAEEAKAQPQLERQREFEREYSQLILYIKEPPRVLARLRFMMGTPCDGGMLATCEDPATHRMVNVMSVPIMYPEDEHELCLQMQTLVGKQNANLVTVIEFSVHAVRLYAQSGFPGIDQRIALAVLERYEGESVLEYLQKEWNIMTNDDFRLLLAQIINGLADLHAEGILHRNIHEKCVILRRPSHIIEEERAMGRRITHPPKAPNLRLGEFWFLYNPRKAGCLYSLGRADWGARSTVPPEALSGNAIDDRSDIWAFGVCVYHWATGGRTLPMPFTLEEIIPHVPLKWTSWVHALLRMCLVMNPKARASAAELKRFLSRRVHGQI